MWPFGSSEEPEPPETEYQITFEQRTVATVYTKRFEFVSGREKVYSYCDKESSASGQQPVLVDFDGSNVRQVNWENVEDVEEIDVTEIAYWEEIEQRGWDGVYKTDEEIEKMRQDPDIRNIEKTGARRVEF